MAKYGKTLLFMNDENLMTAHQYLRRQIKYKPPLTLQEFILKCYGAMDLSNNLIFDGLPSEMWKGLIPDKSRQVKS